MTRHEKKVLVAALLSGEFKQYGGQLKSTEGYCCLGVAEQVCKTAKRKSSGYLQDKWLDRDVQYQLADLNDDEVPFEVIAGVIDEWVQPSA